MATRSYCTAVYYWPICGVFLSWRFRHWSPWSWSLFRVDTDTVPHSTSGALSPPPCWHPEKRALKIRACSTLLIIQEHLTLTTPTSRGHARKFLQHCAKLILNMKKKIEMRRYVHNAFFTLTGQNNIVTWERETIDYLSEALFWVRPAMVD